MRLRLLLLTVLGGVPLFAGTKPQWLIDKEDHLYKQAIARMMAFDEQMAGACDDASTPARHIECLGIHVDSLKLAESALTEFPNAPTEAELKKAVSRFELQYKALLARGVKFLDAELQEAKQAQARQKK